MFIFIWIVISCLIIGLFLWSFQTLYEQKKAWQAFAKKNGWSYAANGLYQPPAMSGEMDGYAFIMEGIELRDANGTRSSRTAIEIAFDDDMLIDCAIATPYFLGDMYELGMPYRLEINFAGWSALAEIHSRDEESQYFFNKKHTQALKKLFELDNAHIMALMDHEGTAIRIELLKPFTHPADIKAFLKTLVQLANILRTPVTTDEDGNPEQHYAQAVAL